MININRKKWEDLKYDDIIKFLQELDDNETFFIEYKNDEARNESLTKEISAFANTYGGYLMLGVENDKRITGCDKWTEERISSVIYNQLSPIPQFDIKIFEIPDICKKIFIIKVEEGIEPPYVTNTGKIYIRLSSESVPVKDAHTLHNLFEKKKNYLKKLEEKLYYFDNVNLENINNLCAYIDFGFGIVVKDKNKIYDKLKHIDYDGLNLILSKYDKLHSISKVGDSLCISIGNSTMKQGNNEVACISGLSNNMEIMADGSFKCRILIVSKDNSKIGDITFITLISTLFQEIYSFIFKVEFIENFIEAFKYEKLVVLKQFNPKYMVDEDNDSVKKFDELYNNHISKYNGNTITTSNRIPLNGFYKIDKTNIENCNLEYNVDILYWVLFQTDYFYLGYIDRD